MPMLPLAAITLGGPGEEDRFTYVLASLLQDQQVARAFLVSVLGLELSPSTTVAVETQREIAGGRVDLRLSGDGIYAILEVKVTAGLHGDQILAYAREVTGHPGGQLYVLTPSTTLRAIQEEAQRQVATLGDHPAASVKVGGVHWQRVAEFMNTLREQQPQLPASVRVYLGDFAELIHTAIEGDRRPFLEDEITTLGTATVADYTERLELVLLDALPRLYAAFPPKHSPSGGRGYFGAKIDLHLSNHEVWMGMIGAAWRQHGRTPYWIQVRPAITQAWDRIAEARGLPRSLSRRGENETLIPLELARDDRSLEEVTVTVVKRASQVLTALSDVQR